MPHLEQGTLVAFGFLAFIALILLVAIFRYSDVGDVLKLWSGIGSLTSLLLGAITTYYFTKDSNNDALNAATDAKNIYLQQSADLQTRVASLTTQLTEAGKTQAQLAQAATSLSNSATRPTYYSVDGKWSNTLPGMNIGKEGKGPMWVGLLPNWDPIEPGNAKTPAPAPTPDKPIQATPR